MIRIRISRGGAVVCRGRVSVPLPATQVWGQLRDFHRFSRQEFFHDRIDVEGGIPRSGARLRLRHRFFIFRVGRVGRICRWKENDGFAFSDLSVRGPRRGFPHVFSYRLESTAPAGCIIHIRVAGRWTANFLPRVFVWLWLRWVMQFAVQHVENEMLVYRVWLKTRESSGGKMVG